MAERLRVPACTRAPVLTYITTSGHGAREGTTQVAPALKPASRP